MIQYIMRYDRLLFKNTLLCEFDTCLLNKNAIRTVVMNGNLTEYNGFHFFVLQTSYIEHENVKEFITLLNFTLRIKCQAFFCHSRVNFKPTFP